MHSLMRVTLLFLIIFSFFLTSTEFIDGHVFLSSHKKNKNKFCGLPDPLFFGI